MTEEQELSQAWATVIGQEDAVAVLRSAAPSPVHAYLFVGPHGSGRRAAARAFAAELLSRGLTGESGERAVRLALSEQHPDLVVIEPDSTVWRFPDPRDDRSSPGLRFVQAVASAPVEGDRKVVVAVDFHLAREEAIGKLLKVIEEPPPSTVILLLVDEVPPEQVTIASRCARVDFGPVPRSALVRHLVVGGADPEIAEAAADAAAGDLGRAELLAHDPELEQRLEAWRTIPYRLDGRGTTVAALVDEVRGHLDSAQGPLEEKHAVELAHIDELEERLGARAVRRAEVIDRHKRAVRRLRTTEVRFGLATLARPYRERLADAERPRPLVSSLLAIQGSAEALERNPMEELLLEALLISLEPIAEC